MSLYKYHQAAVGLAEELEADITDEELEKCYVFLSDAGEAWWKKHLVEEIELFLDFLKKTPSQRTKMLKCHDAVHQALLKIGALYHARVGIALYEMARYFEGNIPGTTYRVGLAMTSEYAHHKLEWPASWPTSHGRNPFQK